MTIRTTSRDAYNDLRDGPVLGHQAQMIQAWVREQGHECSLQEISQGTGIAINAVSGRVNDCKKTGALIEREHRPCRVTGRRIIPVDVPRRVQMDLRLEAA